MRVCAGPGLGEELNSIYGPVFATLCLAYITAKMFNGIFSMVISTVLQCYIMDTEFFPNEADRFAAGSLRSHHTHPPTHLLLTPTNLRVADHVVYHLAVSR